MTPQRQRKAVLTTACTCRRAAGSSRPLASELHRMKEAPDMQEHRIERGPCVAEVVLSVLLIATSGCSGLPSKVDAASEYATGPSSLETAQWSEPYSGPLGYPKGAQRASLG